MIKEPVKLRGFYRIKIGEDLPDGSVKIVGDSGWLENQIVNLGWQDYIFGCVGAQAGSKTIGRAILGTGGAPASNATALPGETVRSTSINNAVTGSLTLRATTNFASGDHPGGTPTLQNAGLINDTASGGTILCGNTYNTSQWQSNQGVSMTYELQAS